MGRCGPVLWPESLVKIFGREGGGGSRFGRRCIGHDPSSRTSLITTCLPTDASQMDSTNDDTRVTGHESHTNLTRISHESHTNHSHFHIE